MVTDDIYYLEHAVVFLQKLATKLTKCSCPGIAFIYREPQGNSQVWLGETRNYLLCDYGLAKRVILRLRLGSGSRTANISRVRSPRDHDPAPNSVAMFFLVLNVEAECWVSENFRC